MKVWTVYEMANRRGPGGPERYTNTGHGTGGVASVGPPGVRGGERVAGSLLAPGLPQAVRVLLRLWLCEWVLLRLWCCARVPLRRWHCAWVLLRLWLFAWVLLRLGAWARVLLRWWLCAGSTSPSCLCVGTGLGCRSTSSCSVASACCWTVCSRPGVASFCEGLFFCVATQSCVSLCSLKRIFRFPLFTADQSGCSHAWPLKLSHPWCLLLRLLNQCGSVLWVVCSRGFVSRPFRCWGFLASFHLCGLPCLDPVSDSNMAVFLLGHSMELCREVEEHSLVGACGGQLAGCRVIHCML